MQIDGLITPELARAVEPLSEPGSQISFTTLDPAVINANGRTAPSASVYFTATPDRLDNTWFPDSAVIDRTDVPGDEWADISAGAARDLGVGPGDQIEVPIIGNTVRLTVRRILAVSRFGFLDLAVAPMSSKVAGALGSAQTGSTPTVLLLRTTHTLEDIRQAVESVAPPGKTQVLARTQWLAQTRLDPFASQPVRAVTTLLGLACLLGLAVREGHSLFRRRHHDLVVLVAIGADRRKLIGTLLLLEAIAVTMALAVAWWLVRQVAFRAAFAPALPPSLDTTLAVALLAGGCAYLVTVGFTTWRRLSRYDIGAALSSP